LRLGLVCDRGNLLRVILLQHREKLPQSERTTDASNLGRENGAPATISRNGQSSIPVFFDAGQAQELLGSIQQSPESLTNVDIQVGFLLPLIQQLETDKNERLGLIQFVPSPEAHEFLKKDQQQNQP